MKIDEFSPLSVSSEYKYRSKFATFAGKNYK